MKIVLATPLYPPEIAGPALYVKELAKRLSVNHAVTVVAYAHLPETLPDVTVVTVEKRHPLPLRLVSYLYALIQTARKADIIYAVNGASVELPAMLASIITKASLILCIADTTAHSRAKSEFLLQLIHRFGAARAVRTVTALPMPRPEILPLETYPAEALATYEASWREHIRLLTELFNHVV